MISTCGQATYQQQKTHQRSSSAARQGHPRLEPLLLLLLHLSVCEQRGYFQPRTSTSKVVVLESSQFYDSGKKADLCSKGTTEDLRPHPAPLLTRERYSPGPCAPCSVLCLLARSQKMIAAAGSIWLAVGSTALESRSPPFRTFTRRTQLGCASLRVHTSAREGGRNVIASGPEYPLCPVKAAAQERIRSPCLRTLCNAPRHWN